MAGNTATDTVAAALKMRMVLEKCALIELKCAEIYRLLAVNHAEHRRLESLWLRASREEEEHARQFDMLCKLKGESFLMLNVEIGDVMAMLAHLDSVIARLKEASIEPLPALKFASQLEEHLSRFHSNSVVVCRDPELKKLLDAMMKNDAAHAEMFDKALVDWLPGKEPLRNFLDQVEHLFREMQHNSLSSEEVVKIAINYEKSLNHYLYVSAVKDEADVRHLVEGLIEKNQQHLARMEETLDRIIAAGDGTLVEEHRLARSEHRAELVPEFEIEP